MAQNGKIAVRLHGKTDCMWNLAEATVKFAIRIGDRRAAVEIRWRSKGICSRKEVNAFTKHMLSTVLACRLPPAKVRRELGGIHKCQFSTRTAGPRAHRTFNTT